MVRIDVGDAIRVGTWVDGYRPTVSQLARIERKLDSELRRGSAERPGTAWSRLYHLAMARWSQAEAQAKRKGELSTEVALSEVLVVRPQALPHTESLHLRLYQDLEKESRNPRYGALLFTYSELYWPTAVDSIDPLLSELEFTERQPHEYADLDGFTKLIKLTVNEALIPYTAPSCAATESLRRMGFNPVYGTAVREE